MISKVPGGYIAAQNRGGDIEAKTYHSREQAEHELLWSYSRHLVELEEKVLALADLFDLYEAGDFGDGDMHRRYMRRLMRECSSLAMRLQGDDPAWSLLGDVTEAGGAIVMEDGTEIRRHDEAHEWMRLKSNRLRHEDMERERQAKQRAEEMERERDPEKRRRHVQASRNVLRAAISIAPPEVVASELKRASKAPKSSRKTIANRTARRAKP